jgi:hypothetical protein
MKELIRLSAEVSSQVWGNPGARTGPKNLAPDRASAPTDGWFVASRSPLRSPAHPPNAEPLTLTPGHAGQSFALMRR